MPQRIKFSTVLLTVLAVVVIGIFVVGSVLTIAKGRYSLDVWEGFIISGIALGAVYALIAIGYTLVYGILFMINFAHGEVFMAGAFTAVFAAQALADEGFVQSNPVLAFGVVLLVSMFTSMVVAILLERLAYRPLRNAPRLVPLITAIGASLVLQYTFRGLYGAGVKAYPAFPIFAGSFNLFGVKIAVARAVVMVSALVLMLALYFFVEKTRTGRAMRAVSESKDVAAMMGIDVNRVIVLTFAIGGLLAGAAGILYTLIFNQVSYSMGFLPGIKAFTAAVLGGIGNIVGAMLGGLVLGLLEAVAPYLILEGYGIPSANQLKDVIAFSVLVLVLIYRPTGFLGRKDNT
ncbi:MAG TPA: branched-chain amino acid ABC transporter permease [Candidatus Limnocylindria bacterium]|nr:branched-chain amino acid ABC transporter permease [Candidatus Limnocylindria bacterium]